MAKDKSKAEGPKGRNDAYTMMLFITLLAIGIGCTLLYLDFDEYGKQSPPKETPPALPKLGGEEKGPGARLEQPPLAPPAVTVAGRPLIRPGEPAVLLPVAVHTPAADAPEAR
jgi:hypothetical protein